MFDVALPSWLCVYAGITLFCYQTIDNLDGRQARRTKSSSPLGLLFDHGIDALNTTLGMLIQAAVIQAGSGPMLYTMWLVGVLPFVFATWEEFFVGKLTLGRINGPTDGVIMCIIFSFIAAIWPGIWGSPIMEWFPQVKGTILEGEKMNMIIVIFAWAGLIPTCLANIWAVMTKNKQTSKVLQPILVLVPFFAQLILVGIWVFYSPIDVITNYPRLFLCAQAFLFGTPHALHSLYSSVAQIANCFCL
jgi:ethanolaminephosphotransferase